MSSRSRSHTPSICPALVPLLAGLAAAGVPDQGAAAPAPRPDRIEGALDGSVRVVEGGTAHPLARPELDRGRLDGATTLHGVSLLFGLTSAQQEELDGLLTALQDSSSPLYHRWLTPEQYAERFGLTGGDLDRVATWLRSQGLVVEGWSRSRTRISFGGDVARIERAFRTELHWYLVNGERHFANAAALSLPAVLSGVVVGVRRLDDFRPRPRNVRVLRFVPEFTSSISGNHFLSPDDFATIYDVAPLRSAGTDGAGQTIAVVGQTTIRLTDVAAFRAAAGLPAKAPQTVLVPLTGGAALSSADEPEADLDVEWSGAVAPGADVVFVYSGSDPSSSVIDALVHAVDNDLAPIISMSYGACEHDLGSGNALYLRQLAQQASAQGQTISAASGDAGAADCESGTATVATTGLAVDVPASIPEVTGVGGNEFDEGTGTYWSGSNGPGGGSALGYIPEKAWNDSGADGLAAGGGGASTVFSKPPWQAGTGVPADGQRDVPDLSLNASAEHDGYLFCTAGSCVNGYRANDNTLAVVGGTSAGAPAFAGILALIAQHRGGGALGNVNPTLYALAAAAPGAFHDVTTGDNAVPCTVSVATGCATGSIGFAAGRGYDQATGLGSIDAAALAASWPGGSATSIALASSSLVATAGESVTFTATVTSGATGGQPIGGAVRFVADGKALGAPAVVSNGQATLTTSTLPGGAHTVSAAYTGDPDYLASASASLTVTIADYRVETGSSGLTLSPGTSAPVVLTVQALGGFAGTVSLSCSSDAGGPSCSVVPSSVVLDSSATTATATLTVSTTPVQIASTASRPPRRDGFGGPGAAASLLGGALVLASRRRRWSGAMPLLLACCVAGAGCGGHGGSDAAPAVAPGTYVVFVHGASDTASGALARAGSVTVVVEAP